MEVNFKANFINKTSIQKYNSATGSFLPHAVSFVELSNKNLTDRWVLKKTSRLWKNSYAYDMYKNQRKNKDLRFFAITEQDTNFEVLEAKKILGLSQVMNIDVGVYNVDYLQTNPQYTVNMTNRKYKKIGTTMLDNLKNVFHYNTLKLTSLYDVIDFYLNNNFRFENFYLSDLVWCKEFDKD